MDMMRIPMKQPGVLMFVAMWCAMAGGVSVARGELHDFALDGAKARTIAFLRTQVAADGQVRAIHDRQAESGAQALTALALLEAGVSADDPTVKSLLGSLSQVSPKRTYARALRVRLFARLGQSHATSCAKELQALLAAQNDDGGWPGSRGGEVSNTWDTALALQALRDIEQKQRGEVPPAAWSRAEAFLALAQNPDGGFGYHPPTSDGFRQKGLSHGLGAAAGASALAIVLEHKKSAVSGSLPTSGIGRYQAAMRWLDTNHESLAVPNWYWGAPPTYEYLWALTEAGHLISPMRLGSRDLDVAIGEALLATQQTDGGWPAPPAGEDRLVASAYALRLLHRIRQPILLNKIMGGPQGTAPFDATHLVEWLGRTQGQDGSWRLLTTGVTLDACRRAPILYLSGKGKPRFPAGTGAAIGAYFQAGGTVVLQPIDGDFLFSTLLTDALEVSPGVTLAPLPKTHRLRTTPSRVEKLTAHIGGLKGQRGQVVLLDDDLAVALSTRDPETFPQAAAVWGNLFALATRDIWPRYKFDLPLLRSAVAAKATQIPLGWISPHPAVTQTLSRQLMSAMSLSIRETAIQPAKAIPANVPMVWMANASLTSLGKTGVASLKRYVDKGGLLLLDVGQGGDAAFRDHRTQLEGLFGVGSVQKLSASHSFLTGTFGGGLGCDLRNVSFNAAAKKRFGTAKGLAPLYAVVQKGRICVLLPRLAVAPAIARTTKEGIAAFWETAAQRVALNALLYALTARDMLPGS
jgi:hypothetical protein